MMDSHKIKTNFTICEPTNETAKFYEEVVAKNFEIIKHILPKIQAFYSLNEELEKQMNSFEIRLSKLELDSQNIHHELRINHLSVDGKINNVLSQYSHFITETAKIKKIAQNLSQTTKQIKKMKVRQRLKDQREEDRSSFQKQSLQGFTRGAFDLPHLTQFPKDIIQSNESIIETVPEDLFTSHQQQEENVEVKGTQDQPSRVCKKSGHTSNFVNFKLTKSISSNGQQKQQEFVGPKSIRTENQLPQRINLKNSTQVSQRKVPANLIKNKSQKIIPIQGKAKDRNLDSNNIIREIQNFHLLNQRIKNNYEQLFSQYCKLHQKQFSQVSLSLDDLKKQFKIVIPKLKFLEDIENNVRKQNQEVKRNQDMMKQMMQRKIDKDLFMEYKKVICSKVEKMQAEWKKAANKEQTKKAVLFLEKKINKLLQLHYELKQPLVKTLEVDQFGCFRPFNGVMHKPSYNHKSCRESYEDSIEKSDANAPVEQLNDKPEMASPNSKRETYSLHSMLAKGTITNSRFNEQNPQKRGTHKANYVGHMASQQDKSNKSRIANQNSLNLLNRKPDNNMHKELKKRTFEILKADETEKSLTKRKSAKFKMIFEYD